MGRIMAAIVAIFIIAATMAMTGRGGGNFYVPTLVAAGAPMHQAATTGQLILVLTAASALLIFQKNRTVDWKLALAIDPPTDVMALAGGYFAHLYSGGALKFVFAGLLVLASFFMLRPAKEKAVTGKKRFGFWYRKFGQHEYVVNLWLAIPITAATGLVAGAVGISGGSFKVPLMVIACGVPMRVAVGTSSAMVAATALMGLVGHSIGGDFSTSWALPLAAAAVAGGMLGGKFSLRTRPESLRKLFALTTLAAALFMVCNAALSSAR